MSIPFAVGIPSAVGFHNPTGREGSTGFRLLVSWPGFGTRGLYLPR